MSVSLSLDKIDCKLCGSRNSSFLWHEGTRESPHNAMYRCDVCDVGFLSDFTGKDAGYYARDGILSPDKGGTPDERMKHFDFHSGEEVETREYSKYGLCPVCGEGNHFPKKLGFTYPCTDCFMTRTDECINIKKAFEELENPETVTQK